MTAAPPPVRTCAVCGAPARVPFRPPPAETAPDLDLRPGEPTRATLPRWMQTCRACGAAGPDLATLPRVAAELVRQPAYLALSGPARPFERWAMIAEAAGETAEAAEALLQAAWMLDDLGAEDGAPAAALRARVAALWDVAPPEAGWRLVDVLRRAGMDGEAQAAIARLASGADAETAAILAFQQARLAAGDRDRHLLSSALRPPARTPHVTHGKPAAGGFWRRLFGRD